MGKIVFPKWIEKGDTIGVVAPSAGKNDELTKVRFNNGKKNLEEKGYKVLFGKNVFNDAGKGRSAPAVGRAEELMKMFENNSVSYIVSASGGDFLCEILPFVDFEAIKKTPKWFQGYSDNTNLTFSITTLTDTATIYGNNFGDYGMEPWHRSVSENLAMAEGKEFIQESFDMCENEFHDRVTGLEGFFRDKEVSYSGFKGFERVDNMKLSGRLIGGCTDVISVLAGTLYEDFKGFAERHKEEGILLYLESFMANSEETLRILWKLQEMSWFDHVNGVLFGRPMFESTYCDTSYEEAVQSILGPLGIGYVFGCDIGHKAPQFTLINGSMAEFELNGNKGIIRQSCV